MKYVISPATIYDADNELFETKIGTEPPERLLIFSAWGKTERESKDRANALTDLLNDLLKRQYNESITQKVTL